MRSSLLCLAAVVAATHWCAAQAAPAQNPKPTTAKPVPLRAKAPDIIYFDGVIYTGNGFAEDKPERVEAIAIGGGKVLAVGSTKQITRLAGPNTHLRDLATSATGNFIFPGFNDAHTHLASAGHIKTNLSLAGVKSLAEMLTMVQEFATALPAGHWITGGRWDHTLWTPQVLPTRQDLDKVTAGHPAFLNRADGHIAIANTAALKAAGITGTTAVPAGGAIDLDSHGEPTGILRESAKTLISKIIPPPSVYERRRADELAIEDAISHGVTSVQDYSEWDDFLVFEQMEKEGKLNLRITEWLPFNAPLDKLKEMRAHHDLSDPMLHTGMLKGFMDGSLGSRTAAMKAPYSDDVKNTGLPQYAQEELNQMASERARAGFQLGFHAIGDRAASMALEAIEHAELPFPGNCRPFGQRPRPMDEKMNCSPPRHRIEHAQVVDSADIARFAELGVIASMQPNHLLTDMNWAESRLGPDRAAYSYAWKAFLDADVHLAFGTDYPVEPITPFRGLYAAVTRMNEAGTKTYFPANRLTRGQALYAYTQGSAYAEFAEGHKGKLIPGYDADFIVVDRDLYKADPPALLSTHVNATFVAGREVFPPESTPR